MRAGKSINKLVLYTMGLLWVIVACHYQSNDQSVQEDIDSLPMQKVALKTLESFKPDADNWSIAGNVQSDYNIEGSMEVQEGTGVLTFLPSTDQRENIFSKFEHGDIELKVDFFVPKGSSSGIFFQGRYEIQIKDSWKVENPAFSDVGGIFEREPEGKSYTTSEYRRYAPAVNAGMAPGLWQTFHILFRAPRFDKKGNKIEHARFEWVDLNGVRIHEDVELTGPTQDAAFEDEEELAPLMIQGGDGPLAFKNLQYKKYNHKHYIKLSELEYKVYDYERHRTAVNFDSLTVISSGVASDFSISELSNKGQDVAMNFSGEIEIPVTGEYFFQSEINEGGHIYININGKRVLENCGDSANGQFGDIIYLEKGTYPLGLSYFQTRDKINVSINYEGPGIELRSFGSPVPIPHESSHEPLEVKVEHGIPELIGSFINYNGEKRTHILTVGHPEGVHFSYDLNRASLLYVWRGPFADVSHMWRVRGYQLLFPMNATVKERSGIPISPLNSDDTFDQNESGSDLSVKKYKLNEQGQPVFVSGYDGITIKDHLRPTEETAIFLRTLQYSAENSRNGKVARIARAPEIERLFNGLYRINGRYYLDIIETDNEEPELRERDGLQWLVIPILRDKNQSKVQYQLIW